MRRAPYSEPSSRFMIAEAVDFRAVGDPVNVNDFTQFHHNGGRPTQIQRTTSSTSNQRCGRYKK